MEGIRWPPVASSQPTRCVPPPKGVAVKRPGDLTFALLNEFLDDLVTVTERDINEMILLMLEKHKLVVEAAGARVSGRA